MLSERKLRAQDLAERYGSPPEELAKLEEHGVLRPSRDSVGRFYSPGDELRLQIALKGFKLGFTLREIAAMIVIVAGASTASLMIRQSSLCRVCLKAGAPYVELFDRTVI